MRRDLPTRVDPADALRRWSKKTARDIRVSMPARVEAFDPATSSVDVQPLIQRVREDGELEIVEPAPIITRVPIAYMRFAGFVLRCPVAVGDVVQLVVCDQEIESLLASPSSGRPIAPKAKRTHHPDDAVAYPGVSLWGDPIPGLADGDLVLGREDGSGSIRIKPDGSVELGGDLAPKEPMLKGDTLVAALQALTVPTAFGPSGPPINAASFPSAKSAKNKVG